MTLDFQENVLRFLCTSGQGSTYAPLLDSSLFDLTEYQVAYDLLTSYQKEYSTFPRNSANVLEFFDRQTRKQTLSDQVIKTVSDTVRGLFIPFDSDTEIITSSIVEFAQVKQTKLLFEAEADNLRDDPDVFNRMLRKMSDIVNLKLELERTSKDQCTFVIAGHGTDKNSAYLEPTPTYLRSLNRMTAAGGFYTPQLIVLMGQPKSYKTGVTLAIARELVRDGERVFYADTENGIKSIRNRFRQGLLNCTLQELREEEQQTDLDLLIPKVGQLGGDMAIGFYPAKTSRPEQVEADLDYLERVHNWRPTVIIWDNPDNFLCNNRKVTETRLIIQHVYFDIIRINEARNCWSLGISQVSKQAVNKETINMKDFAEDFGKAMNCHAAFAICRTEQEMSEGIARILPVVQREGAPQGRVAPCIVKLDEARGQVVEVDLADAARLYQRSQLSQVG